jgi:hypothetical protein
MSSLQRWIRYLGKITRRRASDCSERSPIVWLLQREVSKERFAFDLAVSVCANVPVPHVAAAHEIDDHLGNILHMVANPLKMPRNRR